MISTFKIKGLEYCKTILNFQRFKLELHNFGIDLSKPIFYAIIQVPDFTSIGNAGSITYFPRATQEAYPDDSSQW